MKTSALAKLKQRFGAKTQTGGKGTFRRKKKKTSNLQRNSRDPKELLYRKLIDQINFDIQCVEKDDLHSWESYLKDELFWFVLKLSKRDVDRKYQKSTKLYRLSNIIKNYDDFIDKQLVISKNEQLFFQQNYEFIQKLFNNHGIEFWTKTIQLLKKSLEKKEYLKTISETTSETSENNKEKETQQTEETDKKEDTIELLVEENSDESVTKQQLKQICYEKSREIHPDKYPKQTQKYKELLNKLQNTFTIQHYQL